jgi:hypothetical protein
MVFLGEERRLFITAGRDGAVKVWRVRGKEPREWNLILQRTVVGAVQAENPVITHSLKAPNYIQP